jgi:heat-inducible transcriptional repressor
VLKETQMMLADELSSRQKLILGLVVREYVASATPVGSRMLSEHYDLGVSPATVRNEMARLEELGCLMHPHTSAGRMPTDRGYRYFVEQLMGEVELPLAERRMIRHQFHQARREMNQWMELSAAVLAHAARSAALVTAPQTDEVCFKHVELIHVHGLTALLVLVTDTGLVRQEVLTLMRPLSQASLGRTAQHLNDVLDGLTAKEIDHRLPELPAFEAEVTTVVRNLLRWVNARAGREMHQSGVGNVLAQPEFATGEVARRFLDFFEGSTFLDNMLSSLLGVPTGDVHIIIGTEGPWQELSDLSLVMSRYGVADVATGLLGVLGPRRMSYERAVSAVRYVSDLLSDLVCDWYGL